MNLCCNLLESLCFLRRNIFEARDIYYNDLWYVVHCDLDLHVTSLVETRVRFTSISGENILEDICQVYILLSLKSITEDNFFFKVKLNAPLHVHLFQFSLKNVLNPFLHDNLGFSSQCFPVPRLPLSLPEWMTINSSPHNVNLRKLFSYNDR